MKLSTHLSTTSESDGPRIGTRELNPRLDRLRDSIDHAAHLLPAQGPITVFIHHNTLHAFEDLPFDKAVMKAAHVFGCQPFLAKSRYREKLARGRIRKTDLQAVLEEDLGLEADATIPPHGSRLDMRLAMLQYPLRSGPTEELLWFVAETDALRRIRHDVAPELRQRMIAETRRWAMRDLRGPADPKKNSAGTMPTDASLSQLLRTLAQSPIELWGDRNWEAFTLLALWRICIDGVSQVPSAAVTQTHQIRHRDLLLQVAGADADVLVHDLLIRFCGAFLDQGLAHWQLPGRNNGYLAAFVSLYRQRGGPTDRWLHGLARELNRWDHERLGPLEAIAESLEILGVNESEWDEYISSCLLALRGWGGIIRFLEERPDRAIRPVPEGSLIEFLAIRLLLDRLALSHTARETFNYTRPLRDLRDELGRRIVPPKSHSVEQRAFQLFQLAQVMGWTPEEMCRLSQTEWANVVGELEAFPQIERRRIFHLAYERRFYNRVLDALAYHAPKSKVAAVKPRFQAMFCIDEREESIRRHIEEMAPDAQTFGIAGFFFVGMYYRGADDAHFVPLCPAVIRPQHWVVELSNGASPSNQERRVKTRRAVGLASHQIHVGSRSFVFGAIISAAFGVLATIPLIGRTLFPRLTAQFRRAFGRFVFSRPETHLQLERSATDPGPVNDQIGFSLDEMVNIAERVLRDTGLTDNFARMVLMFGHGSTSMNNPHASAYDCGACGGARGGPNARAIAAILNDRRVRKQLSLRGIDIPHQTIFVGGIHNTSNDSFTFEDLDQIPVVHRKELDEIRALLEEAADRNAHERCRRFDSVPLTVSFAAARQHVEGRAEDLSQVRPELGHATNAVTIIGRRQLTKGLFLDRRAFLNSYDPTQDDAEGTILARILLAAVPVCAGISLEYYFSHVDNAGYGCGTKLPHNITGLLGVIDGAASDLRTGLPWQMVEIHEPMRPLFVIETTPGVMHHIMNVNPDIARLICNKWIRLAIIDPKSHAISRFRNGTFEAYRPEAEQLPHAASSVDWYRGWRDHLEFAEIG